MCSSARERSGRLSTGGTTASRPSGSAPPLDVSSAPRRIVRAACSAATASRRQPKAMAASHAVAGRGSAAPPAPPRERTNSGSSAGAARRAVSSSRCCAGSAVGRSARSSGCSAGGAASEAASPPSFGVQLSAITRIRNPCVVAPRPPPPSATPPPPSASSAASASTAPSRCSATGQTARRQRIGSVRLSSTRRRSTPSARSWSARGSRARRKSGSVASRRCSPLSSWTSTARSPASSSARTSSTSSAGAAVGGIGAPERSRSVCCWRPGSAPPSSCAISPARLGLAASAARSSASAATTDLRWSPPSAAVSSGACSRQSARATLRPRAACAGDAAQNSRSCDAALNSGADICGERERGERVMARCSARGVWRVVSAQV